VTQAKPSTWTVADYERAAQEYGRSLPLEHYMEAVPQATQRAITLASLALVKGQRPDFQLFSELLIQYWEGGQIRRVVPDNMVQLSTTPLQTQGSFNIELEADGPFWVLEYVARTEKGKDYVDSFRRYERDLKVPYCLLYDPDPLTLQLYRHAGKKYNLIPANSEGRYPLPELELEVGLLESWARFWYRGQLLPLPAELQEQWQQQLELTAEAQQRAEQAEQLAKREKQRAGRERRQKEKEKQRAEQEKQRAEQERQQRVAAEAELAQMRALVQQLQQGRNPLP